jgi:membrane fusion protein, multidrug efflux system
MHGSRWMAAAMVAAAVAGCDKHAPPPATPLPVGYVEVARRDVAVVSEWIGNTQGVVSAEIRPKVQGYLIAQNYRDGGVVAAGQQLYQIDPSQYQAALATAEADLARAQANLERSDINVKVYAPLVQKGAVSQLEYLDAVQQQKANAAAVAAAQGSLQQAKLNLAWTKVTSLVGGVAGISQAKVGDLVGPTTVMTTVATLDPIKVEFPITEQQYLAFAPRGTGKGDATTFADAPELTMTLANGAVYAQRGRLNDVGLAVDPTTGTIKVQGLFANKEGALRPGQYVIVRAVTQRLPGAVVVPQSAIVDVQGQPHVAVIAGADTFAIKPVKLGPQDGADRVILEGVAAGDRVIVENLARLRPGEKIAPKPASPPAAAPAKAAPAGPRKDAPGK